MGGGHHSLLMLLVTVPDKTIDICMLITVVVGCRQVASVLKNHRIVGLEGASKAIKSNPLLKAGIQIKGDLWWPYELMSSYH